MQPPGKPPDCFEPVLMNWLPDNQPVEVHIRSFQNALDSLLSNPKLMRESNLSLPNAADPFSCENNPAVSTISELHHGSWWKDSWIKAKCDPAEKEILVPIIFYMDLISLDAKGRLSLTPLNMTLGIFSTATRRLNEAWETIYFHPDASFMKKIGRASCRERV